MAIILTLVDLVILKTVKLFKYSIKDNKLLLISYLDYILSRIKWYVRVVVVHINIL